MAEKIENRLTEQLCEAIASLKSEKKVADFLEDICTISEYKSLSQRFEVARLLDEGVKYEDIVARTGASTATISRVKRCLVYGKDGYEAALSNKRRGLKKRERYGKMADSLLQVPYGTRDVLPGEAAARRQMEDRICGLFTLWGYDEVATPTFEYLDTFAGMGQPGAGAFKFFDRKDNILMLRTDMTTPIARMVATRMRKDTGVNRAREDYCHGTAQTETYSFAGL